METSIIILNYNGESLTRMCLENLRGTYDSATTEILVLDNGSPTNEAAGLRADFPTVTFHRIEKNIGFAGGNNHLTKYATGRFFIFLNNDAFVTPGWLEPLLEKMKEDENTHVCQPKLLSHQRPEYFDFAGAAGGYLDFFCVPFLRGRLLNEVEKDTGQYDAVCELDWACGACFMIRSDIFRKFGGFDESYFAYMEEIDLCMSVTLAGGKIFCIPSSVVSHMSGATLNRNKSGALFLKHKNNLRLITERVRRADVLPTLAGRLAIDVCAAVFYWKAAGWKCGLAPMRAWAAFCLWLPKFALSANTKTRGKMRRMNLILSHYVWRKRHFSDLKL